VSFVDSTRGVQVDLRVNFAKFDGGDRLLNDENVIGSVYDDVLRGDDNANVILGGNGDDTINGYGGDDTIDGQAGNDIIDGGDGSDTCVGEHVIGCEA
jgi:Ca2+-binding RTX toxin-like protein